MNIIWKEFFFTSQHAHVNFVYFAIEPCKVIPRFHSTFEKNIDVKGMIAVFSFGKHDEVVLSIRPKSNFRDRYNRIYFY